MQSTLPHFLSRHPLHLYSPFFITGSWVVEDGPFCIVLAFTGSNPLHKVGGRELGKPAGTFRLWRELLKFWMGWGHREALGDVVAWNPTSQGSLSPRLRQVVLFEGWISHYGFQHSLHLSFCVYLYVNVCVFFVRGCFSMVRGMCWRCTLGTIKQICIITV